MSEHCRVFTASIVMRTFNCRIVFVDEVTLDELDCETTLAHASSSDNHQLVFPEELQCSLASGGWTR